MIFLNTIMNLLNKSFQNQMSQITSITLFRGVDYIRTVSVAIHRPNDLQQFVLASVKQHICAHTHTVISQPWYAPCTYCVKQKAPVTGNNYKDADEYNQQFCKSIPKESKDAIREDWEKLWDLEYCAYVKDLPQKDRFFVSDAKVKHQIAQTIAYQESLHSIKTRMHQENLINRNP